MLFRSAVFKAGDLIEVEVAVELAAAGIDLGRGDRQVLLLGGDAAELGAHGRQFGAAQIHLGAVAEAVVESA